jgi:hypothetical protein
MILAAKIALACAGTVVAGTTVLCSGGFLRVNITERGPEPHHMNVIAPAMLVPIAVRLGSHFQPRRKIDEAADKLQPWMPVIHTALTELNSLDDMTLVEVSESGDHVRVEKVGSAIVVDVDDKDTVVHISAPIRAISSTIQQIADAADSADNADANDSRNSSDR